MKLFIHHGNRRLRIESSPTGTITYDDSEITSIINLLFGTSEPEENTVLVRHPASLIAAMIEKQLEWIEAAGGIVQNESGKILMIFRRGHWDLPKGKIDPGESTLEAAIREIQEETGVDGLVVVESLSPTFHGYEWQGKRVLKKTHWFRFSCTEHQPITVQKEEDIEEARWMSPAEIKSVWDKIYPSLWEVLAPFTT